VKPFPVVRGSGQCHVEGLAGVQNNGLIGVQGRVICNGRRIGAFPSGYQVNQIGITADQQSSPVRSRDGVAQRGKQRAELELLPVSVRIREGKRARRQQQAYAFRGVFGSFKQIHQRPVTQVDFCFISRQCQGGSANHRLPRLSGGNGNVACSQRQDNFFAAHVQGGGVAFFILKVQTGPRGKNDGGEGGGSQPLRRDGVLLSSLDLHAARSGIRAGTRQRSVGNRNAVRQSLAVHVQNPASDGDRA